MMISAEFQILLAGTDPKLSEALTGALSADAVALRTAGTAAEAIRILEEHPVDHVLVDLESLEEEGIELLRRFREHPPVPRVLIIALTAADNNAVKLRAYELGVLDCITKPFEPAVFSARMRASLQTKRQFDVMIQQQRELISARVAAENAMRAKGDFLAAMSHEIRTPMNGVIAMVSLLLETQLNDEQRGYLETIHTSGESLLSIINDILDFSKIEAGKLELDSRPFDLRASIEETLDLMSARAMEKNLDLIYQVDDTIPALVSGDSLRLRQVLGNLLSNALKFTAQGDVLIQVKNLSATAIDEKSDLLHLHFSVRDTGVGIEPAKLARLFKPFMQADKSTARHYGGTGLGLAISKSLVEMMGGKMWAESAPGEGSTFHFTANFQTEKLQAPEVHNPKLADLKILIVDDNDASRIALGEQTAKWGMVPEMAGTPQSALDLSRREQFDIALLDLHLPGMDGVALATEIHKLPGAAMLPLVLLTPLGVRSDAPAAAHIAFANCVAKPVKPAQLRAALERALFSPKKVAAAPSPPPVLDQSLASRLPLQILLVDDNAINQKVAARILQQLGYQPDFAANGCEALFAFDRKKYDIIFMDLMMPEMDGLEATQTVRERQKDPANFPNFASRIVIVAMTAHALQSDREKCMAAGMDDYLAKPIRPKDIRGIVEKWGQPPSTLMNEQPESTPKIEAPVPDVPTVDWDRLNDLTDGNAESLRELVEMYYKQTTQQLAQIEEAVRANKPEDVRRVAHSCSGASATLGMVRFAQLMRTLEKEGASGSLTSAPRLCETAAGEFKAIKAFLAARPALAVAPVTAS